MPWTMCSAVVKSVKQSAKHDSLLPLKSLRDVKTESCSMVPCRPCSPLCGSSTLLL